MKPDSECRREHGIAHVAAAQDRPRRTAARATLKSPAKNKRARRDAEHARTPGHAGAGRKAVARLPNRASVPSASGAGRSFAERAASRGRAPICRRWPPFSDEQLLGAAEQQHHGGDGGADGETQVGDRAVDGRGSGQAPRPDQAGREASAAGVNSAGSAPGQQRKADRGSKLSTSAIPTNATQRGEVRRDRAGLARPAVRRGAEDRTRAASPAADPPAARG